ncbi:MAG: tRNA preQ1(34) S-adenosylmethionine ribosyltransferase-isomerase QueA [Acetivibrionales bacterium]
MKTSDFYYKLPEELIAQEPLKERHLSRLLVLDKETGDLQHKLFKDIIQFLKKGDCLVLNDSRVIPARLLGNKENSGGKIEFVLLKRIGNETWEVILKPGRRAKPGSRFVFGDGVLKAEIIDVVDDGNRLVRFEYQGVFEEILDRVGIVPLPPYITKKLDNPERYQTVYSKYKGSAAAPTAGLHFTGQLLDEIRSKGIEIAFTTLHVGLGTFRPVKEENITEHKMHSEYYTINQESCNKINRAKTGGFKVIAVGTTSCRVLETVGNERGKVDPGEGWTDIFIYPGYSFKVVDAMITNFHLPESTLIMLVSAFAGKDKILKAYKAAVKEKYRFFSFGDAMLIK